MQIIENDLGQQNSRCVVGAQPTLAIGSETAGEEYQLHLVFGASRLSDGRIAVVNSGTHQLRFYDRNGKFLSQSGRGGQGPGEFRDAFYLWVLPGDTVWVGDYAPWQFLAFSPTGEWVRTVRPRPDYQLPDAFGMLADGRSILTTQNRRYNTPKGRFDPRTITVVLHDVTGALIDTIGTWPNGTWGRPTEEFNYTYRLFESFTSVHALGSRVLIGHGSRPELFVYDAKDSLRLTKIVRWTMGDRAVTADELRAHRDRLNEQFKDLEPAEREREMEFELNKDRPVADEFPAFGSAMQGRDGRIWVREFRRPSAPRERQWIAFDSAGRFECRATTRPFETLYEFGSDYLLALNRNELGQEQVLQQTIGRPTKTR